ncbi:ISNCY family transposase, partial [Leptothoe sp. PORK10 BA2]|nr:ISNCY family transposase [Leptothoe sp. PORK10 BA2]
MMKGSFATVVDSFRGTLSSLPDKRTGKNSRYEMLDAGLSAFSVFFTQTPSFLAHQRKMSDTKGRSNAQTLFGVHQIPSDNHIRDLLDGISPTVLYPVFDDIFQVLQATE